jgi:hypothetical protein
VRCICTAWRGSVINADGFAAMPMADHAGRPLVHALLINSALAVCGWCSTVAQPWGIADKAAGNKWTPDRFAARPGHVQTDRAVFHERPVRPPHHNE